MLSATVISSILNSAFRKKLLPIFLILAFSFPRVCFAEKAWRQQSTGISDLNIRSLSIFPPDNRFICAAADKNLYFSKNHGTSWQKVCSLEGQSDEINFVAFDSYNPKIIYLALTKGVYCTKDQGANWKRIFSKVKSEANNVGWVALDYLDSRKIYLGTEDGLFISRDEGRNWKKSKGGLPRSRVVSIAVHPFNSHAVYLANSYGVFKSSDGAQSWKRVYVTSEQLAEEESDEDAGENQSLINCISIDRRDPRKIFIATGEGVLISADAGETWNKLSGTGLTCDYVNFIVVPAGGKNVLYAATQKGIFEFSFDSGQWQECYQGMVGRDVRSLALSNGEEALFAATDRGVFKWAEPDSEKFISSCEVEVEPDFEQELKQIALNEPTIEEVREAALRYGEVIHPDRIKALRRDARLKGLLPTVSVDYDKTIKDGGTTTNFGKFYIGPRDWSVGLSWDIGELVFSEQLRLIDSNARLAVQLRNDILTEVTRLYYERRKLQSELIINPPQTPEEKLDKSLRLEELTAGIDHLTGGCLSCYWSE